MLHSHALTHTRTLTIIPTRVIITHAHSNQPSKIFQNVTTIRAAADLAVSSRHGLHCFTEFVQVRLDGRFLQEHKRARGEKWHQHVHTLLTPHEIGEMTTERGAHCLPSSCCGRSATERRPAERIFPRLHGKEAHVSLRRSRREHITHANALASSYADTHTHTHTHTTPQYHYAPRTTRRAWQHIPRRPTGGSGSEPRAMPELASVAATSAGERVIEVIPDTASGSATGTASGAGSRTGSGAGSGVGSGVGSTPDTGSTADTRSPAGTGSGTGSRAAWVGGCVRCSAGGTDCCVSCMGATAGNGAEGWTGVVNAGTTMLGG
jgi:hypothetical protein